MDRISYRVVFDVRWWYCCDRCGGVGGWIGVSMILGSIL